MDSVNGDQAGAYRRHVEDKTIGGIRVASLLATILVPFFMGLDYAAQPQFLWEFFLIRLACSVGCFVVFGLTYWEGVRRIAFALSVFVSLWVAGSILAMVIRLGAHNTPYYAGLNLVILGVGILFPWTAKQAMAVYATILGLFFLAVVFDNRPFQTDVFVNNTYFLVSTALISTTYHYFSSRLREREFYARTELEFRTEELRRTSVQLQESLQKLQELDHLKSQFFANVSHELRTPLTLVLSPLEAILQDDDVELPGRVRDQLESMHRNAARLLRLINNLLDLAKLESGKVYLRYEPIELRAALSATLLPFQALAQRKKIRLWLEGEEATPVHVDAERLEVVFQNLLANALKFTSEGGEVKVIVSEEPDQVAVAVTDTGVGIAPKDLPIIFDRFAQADGSATRRFGGTGIGLALVKELVELHGGNVSVESEPRVGSTFTVRLPKGTSHIREELRERRAVDLPVVRDRRESSRDPVAALMPKAPPAGILDWAEPPEAAEESAAPARRERILVVEDNPDMRRFLTQLLSLHYRVTAAQDGQEGLEKVREEHPDLVLSDVMMPRLSGYDLTSRLKTDPRTHDIPVILLTAKRGVDPTLEGFSQGADDYLGKPFNTRELLARVRAQLRLRDLAQQLAQAQKMSMLGTLSAGLAHEVRNPINCIANSVPVLRKILSHREGGNGDGRVAAEILDLIADGAERIDALVRDLLRFSHQDQAEVTGWSPTAELESTLKLLKHRVQEVRVVKELRFAGEIEGRPSQLNQVLMNLLDNALRAVGPEGEIRIRTDRDGAGLRLTVEDDGPGIAPEVLPRIFDPFFTTREVGEGTGLGLHLTRQIVEAHGGRIHASSTPGHGALFTVWLPERPQREIHDESALRL
jgi:signal transduction histidine kinase